MAQDFFTNPNIATTLVEQVPCAFAPKQENGDYGTHFVVVMLDKDRNILYLSSQCDEAHGEDVCTSMVGSQPDTCYWTVNRMRGVLQGTSKNQEITGVGPFLTRVLETCVRQIDNKRSDRRRTLEGGPYMAAERRLTRIAQNLGKTMLLKVRYHETEKQFMMYLDGTRVAARAPQDDAWDRYDAYLSTDYISSHSSKRNGFCAVCNDSFSRMGKHTGGQKHADACKLAISRACKFTAGAGLDAVQKKGYEYFMVGGRHTKKKLQEEKDRAVRILQASYHTGKIPNVYLEAYRSPLGLKRLVTEKFAAYFQIPFADAATLLKLAEEESPVHQ